MKPVLAELKFHGGSAEKIIKIRPTVAELSAKNHFPIVNANPLIRGLTPVSNIQATEFLSQLVQ